LEDQYAFTYSQEAVSKNSTIWIFQDSDSDAGKSKTTRDRLSSEKWDYFRHDICDARLRAKKFLKITSRFKKQKTLGVVSSPARTQPGAHTRRKDRAENQVALDSP
jgi:hypothetical protein